MGRLVPRRMLPVLLLGAGSLLRSSSSSSSSSSLLLLYGAAAEILGGAVSSGGATVGDDSTNNNNGGGGGGVLPLPRLLGGDVAVAPERSACPSNEAAEVELSRSWVEDHQQQGAAGQFCRREDDHEERRLQGEEKEEVVENVEDHDAATIDEDGGLGNSEAGSLDIGDVDVDSDGWERDDYYYYDEDDIPAPSKGGSGGRPTDYSTMTVNDLWYSAFDCDTVFRQVRPIHNHSTWTFLRGVYLGVMMTSASSPLPVPQQPQPQPQHQQEPRSGAANGTHRHHRTAVWHDRGPTIDHRSPLGSGFRKLVRAKQTEDGKGRGVYAAEPIQKGELVWTATSYTARFPSGDLYRQFLAVLPNDLACDVLQWAYVQDVAHFTEGDHKNDNHPNASCSTCGRSEPSNLGPGGAAAAARTLRVSVDLDEGSYMNGEDYEPNVGCVPPEETAGKEDGDASAASPPPSRCQQNFYALRDIHVDEELLCYYGDFAKSDGWAEFGL